MKVDLNLLSDFYNLEYLIRHSFWRILNAYFRTVCYRISYRPVYEHYNHRIFVKIREKIDQSTPILIHAFLRPQFHPFQIFSPPFPDRINVSSG